MKKSWPRIAVFILLFFLLAVPGGALWTKTDRFARMMMLEMQERDDLQLVFVGSSVARDHLNAALITERTGKEAFNASIPCLALQGSIALTEELFRTNHPETIVLVVEPYTFESDREGIEAEDTMMPWIKGRKTRWDYYRRLVNTDGWYMDRILLYRDFGAQSPLDVLKTAGLRFFPHQTAALLGNEAEDAGIPVTYEGHGFVRYTTDTRADEVIKQKLQRQVTGWDYDLLPASKEMLLTYRDLCAAHGAKLLVMIYPNITAHNLAEPSFLGYNQSLTFFCHNNGIECVNFALAKPELLPNLDAYAFDLYHVVGEAADILSESVARYLNLWMAGENTDALFYGSNAEYLASIDFVTNCWIERYDPQAEWNAAREQSKKTVAQLDASDEIYLANCNHGPAYTPEYRFSLLLNGEETPLADWDASGIYTCAPDALRGGTLRVYARLRGQYNQQPVFYDFETIPRY